MRIHRDIFRLFTFLLCLKIVYILLIALATYLFPSMNEAVFFRVHQQWPREGGPVFASHFATWDAAHYLFLSEEGYEATVSSCAFYPLWPTLMRGGALLTGGNHLIAGMILSNLFSLFGWIIFYRCTKSRFGKEVAKYSLALLIIFPGSLFYQFVYTESLFFLLLMLLWSGFENNKPLLIFISALLLPITRGIGIFCLFPIAWYLLERPCAQIFNRIIYNKKKFNKIKMPLSNFIRTFFSQLWLILAPFLGWGIYLLFMKASTGNAFEGFEAQKFWGIHSVWNIINIPKFLMQFCDITAFHEITGSGLDRVIFLLLYYSLFLIWKLGKDMMIFSLILGIIPAFSGDLASFIRFCSVVFPLFIGLAVYFKEGAGKKWQFISFLSVCLVFHGVLLWRFVNYYWAG